MIEAIIVMCLLSVNIETDFIDTVVTQGILIDSSTDDWKVDFYKSLSEGEYDLTINDRYRTVSSNDCIIVEQK